MINLEGEIKIVELTKDDAHLAKLKSKYFTSAFYDLSVWREPEGWKMELTLKSLEKTMEVNYKGKLFEDHVEEPRAFAPPRGGHEWLGIRGGARSRIDLEGPHIHNADGKDNYVILEADGNGIYYGAHLDIDCFHRNPNDWYGEGDDMTFIDGERWPPSLNGTGTEDWFHCAYCPTQEYNAPYHGVILHSGTTEWPWKGKQTVYRYHIEDPLRFRKSIKVTIEYGHANKLSNDYSSTAYYYLSEPKRGGPPLPPVDTRLPRPNEETYVPKS